MPTILPPVVLTVQATNFVVVAGPVPVSNTLWEHRATGYVYLGEGGKKKTDKSALGAIRPDYGVFCMSYPIYTIDTTSLFTISDALPLRLVVCPPAICKILRDCPLPHAVTLVPRTQGIQWLDWPYYYATVGWRLSLIQSSNQLSESISLEINDRQWWEGEGPAWDKYIRFRDILL